MTTYMDQTRNPNITPDYFLEQAAECLVTFSLPPFTNPEEAVAFIETADILADALIERMQKDGSTYSEKTILLFGSPIGEAFRRLLGGEWKFSPKQNRWVIAVTLDDGAVAEFNVFNKFEKRLTNGMEDSILYFLQAAPKTLGWG